MKGSLRDFSRQPLTRAEQDALWNTVIDADPIATAILGVAMVEHELERLLRRRLPRKDDATWKELLGDNGPLGTFNTKITLGYAFRLYDNEIRSNLEIVRDIRNAFAHSKRLISYDHELILGRLKTVKTPKGIPKRFRALLADTAAGKLDGKTSYIYLCLIHTNYLLKVLTRSAESSLRSVKRRAKTRFGPPPPYLGLFGALAASPGSPSIGSLGLYGGRQSDDPTSEAPLTGFRGLLDPKLWESDSKDK